METLRPKGIVIAGTASGVGKTTVTLGLLQALRSRGLAVQPFKVGPDFIDPGFHRRVAGLPSRNLDGWMLSLETVRELFARHAAKADVALVEGVMGLFDGYDGRSEAGSTAQIAKLLGLPVVLVVDARAMARSAGAVVYGFERYDPDLKVAGVIFNHLGSDRHFDYLSQAVSQRCAATVLGYLKRETVLELPQRHLGLVRAEEQGAFEDFMKNMSNIVETTVNIEEIMSIIGISKPASHPTKNSQSPVRAGGEGPPGGPARPRLAVALDEAFSFYYPDNLDLLEALGVELCPFSPLRDEALPENIQGLYLGGGYPELHARALAANEGLRRQIRQAAEADVPVYAECGGLMYLCRAIVDLEGERHEMVGLFPTEARMLKKRKALGYVEVRLSRSCLLGEKGLVIRGHEFHYSELADDLLERGVRDAYELLPRRGQGARREGYCHRRVLASYAHLHFASNRRALENLVEQLRTSQPLGAAHGLHS